MIEDAGKESVLIQKGSACEMEFVRYRGNDEEVGMVCAKWNVDGGITFLPPHLRYAFIAVQQFLSSPERVRALGA